MALIGLRNVALSFGGPPLLENVDLAIEPGERICLLGRNGAGKSTLMKIISGELEADSGEVIRQQGLKTAYLAQQVPAGGDDDVFTVVAAGVGNAGELISRFHQLSHKLSETGDMTVADELCELQAKMDAGDCWQMNQQVESIITRMGLDPEAKFAPLSAGMKRRVLLARGLVCKPDILLLDEPTNHLDIEAILWVEDFLLKYEGTLVFVTHDRAFLQKLATRIVDIDRTRVASFSCDYGKYLERKEQMLSDELKQNELFDKRLAEEEVWIRQGVKERRTRNEGRVRRLKDMREHRSQRKDVIGKVKVELQAGPATGRKVIEAKHINFSYNADKSCPIVLDFSTLIQRGDRVGIIGPNGSGKSTLIKILLNELETYGGHVRHGTNLEVAYFDQLHSTLDLEATVQENLCPGTDKVVINGKPRHALGYLKDFLFTAKQARNVVGNLSGGERNRLLLAKLFAQPANVLVLDEPTNDLDMETLELLEELLDGFEGTILMVSHDRAFLNNVVTSTIAMEGDGLVKEYGGGYDDWLIQSGAAERKANLQVTDNSKKQLSKEEKQLAHELHKLKKKEQKPKKLSFNDKKELDSLPKKIEDLETQIAAIHEKMADPEFYKGDPAAISETSDKAQALDLQLQQAYTRWEELELLAEECNS